LGINRNQLYKWQQQINPKDGAAFPGKGRQSGSAAEIARLKRELERVSEERDILKKPRNILPRSPGEIPVHQGSSFLCARPKG
jgi:transposase